MVNLNGPPLSDKGATSEIIWEAVEVFEAHKDRCPQRSARRARRTRKPKGIDAKTFLLGLDDAVYNDDEDTDEEAEYQQASGGLSNASAAEQTAAVEMTVEEEEETLKEMMAKVGIFKAGEHECEVRPKEDKFVKNPRSITFMTNKKKGRKIAVKLPTGWVIGTLTAWAKGKWWVRLRDNNDSHGRRKEQYSFDLDGEEYGPEGTWLFVS